MKLNLDLLLAAGIWLAALVSTFAQANNVPRNPSAGTPGVASRRAVVDFTELAEHETETQAAPDAAESRPEEVLTANSAIRNPQSAMESSPRLLAASPPPASLPGLAPGPGQR